MSLPSCFRAPDHDLTWIGVFTLIHLREFV